MPALTTEAVPETKPYAARPVPITGPTTGIKQAPIVAAVKRVFPKENFVFSFLDT